MRASEIRDMTAADIRTRIVELEEERFRLKFKGATETLEDPLRLRWVRKDIARLQTVLAEMVSGKVKTSSGAPAAKRPAAKSPAKRAAKSAARR